MVNPREFGERGDAFELLSIDVMSYVKELLSILV